MSDISEVLQAAHDSEGAFDSHGTFQVDFGRALQKFGASLLPNAEQALLKLVQFAHRKGAGQVRVENDPRGFTVSFLGLPEARSAGDLLEHLSKIVADPKSDPYRDLLVGVSFFLARSYDLVVSRWRDNQLVDCAATGSARKDPHRPSGPRFPFSLSIQFCGSKKTDFDPLELKNRLAYCTTQVSLNGVDLQHEGAFRLAVREHREDLPNGPRVTVVFAKMEPASPKARAEVIPIQHGVALDSLVIDAPRPGLRVVLEADSLVTNLDSFRLQSSAPWNEADGPLCRLLQKVAGEAEVVLPVAPAEPEVTAADTSTWWLFLLLWNVVIVVDILLVGVPRKGSDAGLLQDGIYLIGAALLLLGRSNRSHYLILVPGVLSTVGAMALHNYLR